MGDAHDCPDLIACSPVGYSYVDRPRPRADNTGLHTNHGGVVLFYRDDLRTRQIELPEYKSFAAIGAFLHCPRFSSLTIVNYRPGSVSVSDDFFEDFGDLLERISTYSDLLIIGDINVHLDVLADQSTINCHLEAIFNTNTSRVQLRSSITVDGKDIRLPAFLSEPRSARYSSAPSITTV